MSQDRQLPQHSEKSTTVQPIWASQSWGDSASQSTQEPLQWGEGSHQQPSPSLHSACVGRCAHATQVPSQCGIDLPSVSAASPASPGGVTGGKFKTHAANPTHETASTRDHLPGTITSDTSPHFQEKLLLSYEPASHPVNTWIPKRGRRAIVCWNTHEAKRDAEARQRILDQLVKRLLDERGVEVSWPDVMRDVEQVEAVEVTLDGNRYPLRPDLTGQGHEAFAAADVRPPTKVTPLSNPPIEATT